MVLKSERNSFSFHIVLLLVTIHTSNAIQSKLDESNDRELFEQWMARHGTTYPDHTEKEKRFEIFRQNFRYIEDFNGAGNRAYRLGLNEFSDLTIEEFRSRYMGNLIIPNSSEAFVPHKYVGADQVPEVDWVAQGAANSVQNQRGCRACWAFSVVAAIEAQIKIKKGVLPKLSEQQLVDCDSGSSGCKEGRLETAFRYVVSNGGISSLASYPYVAKQGTCNTSAPKDDQISGMRNVARSNEAELLKAVAQQPVSISISGEALQFKDYESGIYSGEGCGTDMHHAVVIVGYGTSPDGTKYWKLRNSWGPSWGEGGYMRIRRELPGVPGGACGLALFPFVPT